jgi:hypothetical protein
MASTLDPDSFSENATPPVKGHDIRSLGPSDSSDSGSDVAGHDVEDGVPVDTDTDRYGTGERVTTSDAADVEVNADIAPDRIVKAREAGLGAGLDQAEEARLGVTDEELSPEDDSDD